MSAAAMDRSAPGVRVTLVPDEHGPAAEPFALHDRILSLTYEDTETRADKLSLQLDNFDLSLFERPELAGGAILEVSWGYPGCMAPPRRVVVRKLKGFATLTIEGHALSVLMNKEARTRRWEGVRRSEVARQVAAEYGYADAFADIEDTRVLYDVINQAGETDARFLKRLAAKENFAFFVDVSGLHFHRRRQEAAPSQVLTWYADPGRGDVQSISMESDLSRRAGRVTVRGRDPLKKTTIEANANAETTARSTLGDVIEVVDPESRQTRLEARSATASVHATPASSSAKAAREADARFIGADRETVKLSVQTVGDPTLAAKTIVELRGLTPRLSGKYYVTEAKHTVNGSGYATELKLTKDGSGRLAQVVARAQGGEHNTTQAQRPWTSSPIERVDPETRKTALEYPTSQALAPETSTTAGPSTGGRD
jgi:phage protein D